MKDRNTNGRGKQGFASMPKSRVQEIAAKGGRASHSREKNDEQKTQNQLSSKE